MQQHALMSTSLLPNGEPPQPFLNSRFPPLLNVSGLFLRLEQPSKEKERDTASSADLPNEANCTGAAAATTNEHLLVP